MNTTSFIYSLIATSIVSGIAAVAVFVLTARAGLLSKLSGALISLATGILIGDVFIHLLPELIELQEGYQLSTSLFILTGIGLSLSIEALIHCHNHQHVSSKDDHHTHHTAAASYLSLISDSIHNLLDGISIAASFVLSPITGVITTVGIILHEIPQELADVSIMSLAGWSRAKILIANLGTALTALIGVVIFAFITELNSDLTASLIGFAIGQLIYIALADLVPEIHKHKSLKAYFVNILVFTLGVGVMLALTVLE